MSTSVPDSAPSDKVFTRTTRDIVQRLADRRGVISPLRKLSTGKTKAPNTLPRGEWRDQICAAYRKTVEAFIETGRLLVEAKVDLDYGQFEKMIREELPFKPAMARKLMAIACHPILSDRSHENDLPPCWTVLYELSQVDRRLLEEKIADGTVNPRMERKDAAALRPPRRRQEPRQKSSESGIGIYPEQVRLIREAAEKVAQESATGDEGLYRSALEHLAQIVATALQATER